MITRSTFNVFQLGLGFFLFFVAFNSQGFIQEAIFASIPEEAGIDKHAGYYGLSTYYAVFTVANLFIAPIIDWMGPRWAMGVGAFLTLLYELGFLHLNSWYFFATSALSGFGAALAWPAQGTYLTWNSNEKTLERNCSILWAMSQASQVVGGIILLLVFHHSTSDENSISQAAIRNSCLCFSTVLALSIVVFLLLQVKPGPSEHPVGLWTDLGSTFRLMFTKRMFYLAIVFSYTGIVQSFWTSIYPTCISFTERLGDDTSKIMAISAICSGLGQMCVCFWIGSRAFLFNRRYIILLGCILHCIVFLGVYISFPNDASLRKTDGTSFMEPSGTFACILSFILGFGDGCWNTQVYVLLIDVFPSQSNQAFALFNFYQSLLTSASLFYSSKILLTHHLLILTATTIIGAFSYFAVDKMGKFDNSILEKKDSDECLTSVDFK